MTLLFSIVPSALIAALWVVGLIGAARHPDRGSWRTLAIAGFGTLAAAALLGVMPSVVLTVSGYNASIPTLFTGFSLVSFAVTIAGIGLLVAAMPSGRPAPTTPPPDALG